MSAKTYPCCPHCPEDPIHDVPTDGHEGPCDLCEREHIDVAHLERQREWSRRTFGPGVRLGVLDHMRKELVEVEADPTDLGEWVDLIILAFDGAWRGGHEPAEIIAAVKDKQSRNERRVWPDWRTLSTDVAIEHDRTIEERP